MSDRVEVPWPRVIAVNSAERYSELELKRAEYWRRLENTLDLNEKIGLTTKIVVVNELLEHGRVYPYALFVELIEYVMSYGGDPENATRAFRDACLVIANYCENEGVETTGGTGLQTVQLH